MDALEILLVEDEVTLITDTWQDVTGGPSFEPAAAPAAAATLSGPASPTAAPPAPGAAAAAAAPAGACSAGGDGGASCADSPSAGGPAGAGAGARLVFVVCQSEAAGALARIPEVVGDMDTLDVSGLGLGNAGAQEVAQVKGGAVGGGAVER
jgi:hypothetical protein